ncbi:diguanylate cyclase [Rhodocyclus gracilis]|uniref:diguanylate cyclase n=1 Tax=Rhodocyclus tenuis TaxID=1066 RepID=A0A6L5JU65_RHOTE|nr:diguanylate cyclase [Rhodocyclus gracilis]MQY50897.1 diguanylate cyclase [Rhodocyclus gracilis]
MKGDYLVAEVMQRELLECAPHTPVATAAARMRAAGCGSILIVENDLPCGIWTASDALSGTFNSVADLQQPVRALMSAPVRQISPEATLGEAAQRFQREGIRHLLVVDENGQRCGMVTQTDVVRHQAAASCLTARDVASVARRRPVIVTADRPLAEVRAELRQQGIDALVVCDDERMGIITGSDIVGALADAQLDIAAGAIAHFPLLTIRQDEPLFAARRIFARQGIRHLGVTDAHGSLVSLLAFSDILDVIESDYVRDLLAEIEWQAQQVKEGQRQLVHQTGLTEAILNALPIGVQVRNAIGEYLIVNEQAAEFLGRPAADLLGQRDEASAPATDGGEWPDDAARLASEHHPFVREQVLPDGRILLAHQHQVEVDGAALLIDAAMDVTDWKRADALMVSEHRILELIAVGEPLSVILSEICQQTERHMPGASCAIELLDGDGVTFRDAVAPSLSDEFRSQRIGLAVGPTAEAAGAAVYLGHPVRVDDIASSPLWAGRHACAAQNGMQACWSTPLFSAGRRALGAFSLYFHAPRPELPHEQTVVTHAARLATVAIEHYRHLSELRRLATTDPLTNLNTRAHFLAQAEAELARTVRFERALAVLMIDLDHFKRVNDSNGHAVGDEALRLFARVFADETRSVDLLGRIGGEEFAAVLPETGEEGAQEAAERIRRAVEAVRCVGAGHAPIAFTVSIGIAIHHAGDSIDTLLARADRALYRAKDAGRNRCALASVDD